MVSRRRLGRDFQDVEDASFLVYQGVYKNHDTKF